MGDEVFVHRSPRVFSISAGDSVIADDTWWLRKAKTLIKLLALAPERRLHVDQAGELLWAGGTRTPPATRLQLRSIRLHVNLRVRVVCGLLGRPARSGFAG